MARRLSRTLKALLLCAVLPSAASAAPKLYWFIPDGMRADPSLFDVYRMAEEGRFPNLLKMMRSGAYGYSMPTYPGHTPTNFATLLTGAYPERHGVADGPMRLDGASLEKPSLTGFSSAARKIPAIWKVLEKRGYKVALVSIPGSTPPELDSGMTIRGRWSGWGADFHAVNFETSAGGRPPAPSGGRRLFYQGLELTRYVAPRPASGWKAPPASALPPLELELASYGATVYAYVFDDPADGRTGYSRVLVSTDKREVLGTLGGTDEWTDWRPIDLRWGPRSIPTRFRACLIKQGPEGFVKLRLLYDLLNETIVEPGGAAAELAREVGPMVDFPDNWPAQLNRYPEEKAVLLSEARMSLDWHRRLLPVLFGKYSPDAVIQDIYTPNQMLESRWWLRYVDPDSPDYGKTGKEERARLWEELMSVYRGLDDILGQALEAAGPETLVVLSSDHGVIPIRRELRINNLLAKEGLLAYVVDPQTKEPRVDWARTKAIHLRMTGIYLNPEGLAGPRRPGSGPGFERFRRRVAAVLGRLRDDDGTKPIRRIVEREKAGELRLPPDRVADLVLVVRPGYALTEEMDEGGAVFAPALQSGYKQALTGEDTPGLWTPFVVMGPGVRKGLRLPKPVRNVDQAPTLLTLLGVPVPETSQGRVITELMEPR